MAKKDAIEKVESNLPRAIAGKGMDAAKEILQENLGASASLGIADLTRISFPSGGGTVWEVLQSDGSFKNEEAIVGVVVGFQDGKAYWEHSLDETGGGSPPDCRSDDLIHGIGNPGILCSECEFDKFGSANKGEGKACKDLRFIYILSGNSLLPKVIVVPPTSLKAVKKAFIGLASEMETPYYGVSLRLTLAKAQNKAGITYSKLVVSTEEKLDEVSYERAKAYKEMLAPMLQGMSMNVLENSAMQEEADDE